MESKSIRFFEGEELACYRFDYSKDEVLFIRHLEFTLKVEARNQNPRIREYLSKTNTKTLSI